MNITLIQTGKTHFDFVKTGFGIYARRLKHYCNFNYIEITQQQKPKTNNKDVSKKFEAELQLKLIKPTDFLILLDDKGQEFASPEFSRKLEKWLQQYSKIVFLIGGAYGFDSNIYQRANVQLSLSKFTFSHQLVKLIFAEQLYRAFTIIKNLPYHHE